MVPGLTQDGSKTPVHTSFTVTAPGVPLVPSRVMRNCGSPTAVVRFSPDSDTLPVASSVASGRPGIGVASPSWNATVPLSYADLGGSVICREVYVAGWHSTDATTKLDARTRMAPWPQAPPV